MAIFARKSKTDIDSTVKKTETSSSLRPKRNVFKSAEAQSKRNHADKSVNCAVSHEAAYPSPTPYSTLQNRTPSIDSFTALPPTSHAPRASLSAAKERGYFQTSNSDSGYESAETPYMYSKNFAIEETHTSHQSESRSARLLIKESALARTSAGTVLPPISILDGFKVNTKGRILDEEGDIIGELCEGDLLDCVRQKANSRGEVLDDCGRVVGRVRTVPRSAETPLMQAASLSTESSFKGQISSNSVPISPLLLAAEDEANKTPRGARRGSEASIGALPIVGTSRSDSPVRPSAAAVAKSESHGHDRESSLITGKPEDKRKGVTTTLSPTVTFASPEYRSIEGPISEHPRTSKRSESQRAVPTFSRSSSRMSLNSVLANKTAEESKSAYTPSLFSYKGEIPEADGPQGTTRTRFQPSNTTPPALNIKIAHVSSGAGQYRVNAINEVGGTPGTRPALKARTSINSSYRRSPLSSNGGYSTDDCWSNLSFTDLEQDITPSESPDGTDSSVSDDGKSLVLCYSPSSATYAGRTAHTQSSATSRTYFTHAGRVTLQADGEVSGQHTEITPKSPAAEPIDPVKSKERENKKTRFGFFGKKD